MEVPFATSLQDYYPTEAVPAQIKRWEGLLSKFESRYGHPAEFVSRSPGRVNLIGEHIDYSMYEVLPMAISADVLMAVARLPEKSHFKIANVNERFPPREFEVGEDGNVDMDATAREWSNYLKAALQGVTKFLRKKGVNKPLVGMEILVDGTVPAGSGLSSSSAVLCSALLAAMNANEETPINKTELCELAIVSERAVGVNAGGMDQAASICSQKGSASYVSFLPELKVEPVKFPEKGADLTFIVAQSLVESDKHVSAAVCYNLRVVECTLATVVLTKIFGLKKDLPIHNAPLKISLRGFHDLYFEEKQGVEDNMKTSISEFSEQLSKLQDLVEDYLPQEEGYTREQVSEILHISVDELNEKYMSKFPVRAERFKLRQRALHVFAEANRVLRFRSLLAEPPEDGGAFLKELGAVMNEGQDSCRDVYECSAPELDELCRLARGAGSAGGRLSGAGWGGASVHLVPKDKVESVMNAWTEKYYKKKWPDIDEAKLKEAMVVSEPGSGAFLFKVTGSL